MADKTITAANSAFMLAVRNINGGVGVLLQGYGTDTAFETEAVEPVEAVVGVDGRSSFGWLPTLTMQTITLQADSPSIDLFELWAENSRTLREVQYADAVIVLPGLQRKYNCIKGVLSQFQRVPGARKTMEPRTWRITWDTVSPAPY